MRPFRHLFVAATAFAALTVTVNAQQPAGARPTANRPAAPAATNTAAAPAPGGATAAVRDAKIALIVTEAFMDEQNGIGRYTTAMRGIDREFQPRRTEMQKMQERYNLLVKEINDQKALSAPDALAKKADEAETLKRDLERRQQDGQRDLEKRMREVMGPIQETVYKALDAYAKERGITMIIDASQVPVLYAADGLNITRDFITYFNQRNPAAAASATSTTTAPR